MKIKKTTGEVEFRQITGYTGELNIWFSEAYMHYSVLNHSKNKEYMYAFDDSFVMPVLIRSYMGFTWANILSEPHNYGSDKSDYKEFLNECMRFLRDNSVQWVSQSPIYGFFESYPDNSKVIKFGNIQIDLTQEEDSLFNSYSKTCRKNIRRGINAGVEIKIGGRELIEQHCDLESVTWRRSGINLNHKDDSYYADMFNTFGENIAVGIAYKDEIPQYSLVVYYNEMRAYGMLAGRSDESELGGNNLLYWEMMKYLKNKGVKTYVIVGYRINVDENSKLAGIQRFKDSFKGVLHEDYLFKIVFNKPMYWLYNVLSILRKQVSGKASWHFERDVVDQEISKWSDLNQ